MHPILAQVGAITIYTYGVLVAAGVILGLWYARRQAARAGLPPREIWNLGIYMIFGALIVSKLWLILSDWSYYAANPSDIFSLTTFQSAGTFYGGLLGAILTIFVYARSQKMPLLACAGYFGGRAAAGPRDRAAGMFRRRMLLRQADHASLGRERLPTKRRSDWQALPSTRRCILRNSMKRRQSS